MSLRESQFPVRKVEVSAYTVPTDYPESDGTLEWDSTTIVIVRTTAGDEQGLGYTYADTGTATLIQDKLAGIVDGRDVMDVPAIHYALLRAIRNLGRPGICSMAISALDASLCDLKARILGLPLAVLLGRTQEGVRVYGSGGFTSYSLAQIQSQLGGWAERGFTMVKMKVGRNMSEDIERVRAAREAIGPEVGLFVDGNGAYTREQALYYAEAFARFGVQWFEEPVTSDDLEGLNLVRNRAPMGMVVAAGEYGYDLYYFRRMVGAQAVDVLQADCTRCGGVTGFLGVGALCQSFGIPLSGHTAPAQHLHPCCALSSVRHLEYFHDHVRIEGMLFDGTPEVVDGVLRPDWSRPGLGLELKPTEAARYAA